MTADRQQQPQQEPEIDLEAPMPENQQNDVPIESYGEFKMQMFKKNARQILGVAEQPMDQSNFIDNFEYKTNAVGDIVSAYKSLKNILYKA